MNAMTPRKILVIEDHNELRQLIGRYLAGRGWEVAMARGASECWDRLKEFYPRVILLDMVLSQGSGFEIAQTLKKIRSHKDIPIVAMTGLYARHEVKRCLQAGCNDVLLKPFSFTVLDNTLTNLADRAPRGEMETVPDGSTEGSTAGSYLQ